MDKKPIFLLTHPRSRSTAFLRVMMTRPHVLNCLHQPFAECFYFGPERSAERYANGMNEERRLASGFIESTYCTVMEKISNEFNKGTRLFIKDMAKYLVPPGRRPVSIAPSLLAADNNCIEQDGSVHHFRTKAPIAANDVLDKSSILGAPCEYHISESRNPTVMPSALLKQFHFVFLIRPPRDSVPSYYRLTFEPYSSLNGMYYFLPNDVSYSELRVTFDYLREIDAFGPYLSEQEQEPVSNGHSRSATSQRTALNVCVIDSDDLVDYPAETLKAFCDHVGIDYSPDMLAFTDIQGEGHAATNLKLWGNGFHEEAMESKALRSRDHVSDRRTDEECFAGWVDKYGKEGANIIKQTVESNVADYEYLKRYAIKIHG